MQLIQVGSLNGADIFGLSWNHEKRRNYSVPVTKSSKYRKSKPPNAVVECRQLLAPQPTLLKLSSV